jgi:hypothetical protein
MARIQCFTEFVHTEEMSGLTHIHVAHPQVPGEICNNEVAGSAEWAFKEGLVDQV